MHLNCTIRSSTAARLPKLWVRIPPGGMDVCRECCVLTGRSLFDVAITHPTDCGASLCTLETSRIRKPWPAMDSSATGGGCTTFRGYFHIVARCTDACDVTSCYGRITDTVLKSWCTYGILARTLHPFIFVAAVSPTLQFTLLLIYCFEIIAADCQCPLIRH
jgi:hypothetical protein